MEQKAAGQPNRPEPAEPHLRPDRIERARALLNDPDYPGIEVARAMARSLVPGLKRSLMDDLDQ